MGRGDGGDSERLLARLSRGPGRGPRGWSDGDGSFGLPPTGDTDLDPFPPTARAGGGRHGDGAPGTSGAGWRVSGVPPGLAVLLLLVAVLAVVFLGRGGGSEEVLVGPAGVEAGDGADVVAGEAVDDGLGGDATAGDPSAGAGDGAAAGAGGDAAAGAGGDAAAGEGAVGGSVPGDAPDGNRTAVDGGSEPGPAAVGPMLVHVDGAVQRPGVVELPAGARVGDAVEAAGGVTDEADTRLVNLARPLADGELVVVPRPGEEVSAPGVVAGPPETGAAPAPGAEGEAASTALVDVNTADAAALDELPGIGPVLAERIVTWRTESGPFGAVDDLTSVSGIGPAVMADIRDLVTV